MPVQRISGATHLSARLFGLQDRLANPSRPSARRTGGAALAAALLLAATPAHARHEVIQPVLQQSLPVELAMLDTHVGLGFTLSAARTRVANGVGDNLAIFALSAEGQIALADRVELEINVPFVARGFAAGLGRPPFRDVHFGDVQLGAKLRLFHTRGRSVDSGLSVYANGTLPTTSLDLPNFSVGSRGYGGLHTGLSATFCVSMFTLGVNAGLWATFYAASTVGDVGFSKDDIVLWDIDLFTAAWVHPMIAIQLAWQVALPVPPAGDVAFVLAPAIQFYPAGGFHVDAGARIAVTDAGQVFTGGRAALVLGFAYDF